MIAIDTLLGYASILGLATGTHINAIAPRENEILSPIPAPGLIPKPADAIPAAKTFTLRHIYHHGAHDYPLLHRYIDVPNSDEFEVTSDNGLSFESPPQSLRVNVASTNIQRLSKRRPADIDHLLAYYDHHGTAASLPASAWSVDEVTGPNITDKETIISFAKMAANAYVQNRDSPDWLPVGSGFNYTDDFGWEADGLRGHVYADEKNHTVVIGLKGTSTWFDKFRTASGQTQIDSPISGTSPAIWDGADTTGNDKLNDNLFGSCCCGQGGPKTWKTVCNCMTNTYTCNSTCLVKSLRQKGHYYRAVRELYHNVTERYPTSEVWLSGHSLGGVVSSLLGLTYGLPTITFEAFPDALAASRLGLPTPPGYRIGSHQSRSSLGIHHIGHTADPIYMGTCNGLGSFCSIAGYAFQGLCHTGKRCVYDTVKDFNWRSGIGTHKIVNVIKEVLEVYKTVPSCEEDVDCQDCFDWKFFESNGTQTTTKASTSTSTIQTRTRTETCKTPGWFGCLDETTTSQTTTTTTKSTTSSTSSCRTPGWFGCKDKDESDAITTTMAPGATLTSASTTVHSTTSCRTPGWLGCKDALTAQPSSTAVSPTATVTSRPSSTSAVSSTLPVGTCLRRNWLGWCKDAAVTHRHDL